MSRREFFGGVIGAAVSGSALLSSPLASEAVEQSCLPELTAGEKRRRRRFPNVVLRTHENKEVRFYDDLIKGKTVLVNFMYTGCVDDCPLTTANLARVQRLLGDRVGGDLFIYSITVDPAHDTPLELRTYVKRFGIRPGWLFLTGRPKEIARVRRAFGDDPNLPPGQSDHLGLISYGIEPLERWEACPALTKPESIARYVSWLEPKGRGALQGQTRS